jgi:hypothetical protein
MASIRQYINSVKRFVQDRKRDRVQKGLEISLNTLALTKRRIQSSGTNKDGRKFERYSKIYADRRKRNGLQTRHVDFTDTGRLWNSIKPIVVRNDLFMTIIELLPRDRENQVKLAGQLEKRGNILEPSKKEIETAQKAYEQDITNKLNKI